ncbi:MAG: UDP-N-acetylglucosamine 1-carboxyvinyltransferase [Candidatus Sericytochromatia bacterium]|nr:UDP-N-acetylglucosamine 1-carboxyvinyltransferase [Candidatus Sericytochromatia bacterium]
MVSGAKNAALAIMAGCVLGEGPIRLQRVPFLTDIEVMSAVLRTLGVTVARQGDSLVIDATHIDNGAPPYELVSKMRASFFILGPLVARLGKASIPLPGGCAIGSRPVDLHLKGLKAMGCEVVIDHGTVHVTAEKLVGAPVYLDYPSVGATENIMMAAVLADGRTTIENAAQEPEIADLAKFLNGLGAKITGAGTDTIIIDGVKHVTGGEHSVIGDRIEAGTYLIAGAMTRGRVQVQGVPIDAMGAILSKLQEVGAMISIDSPESCTVFGPDFLRATDLRTLPFPGFPTDLQAPFMAMLAVARGTSMVAETVFENRFLHVDEFQRMGAQVRIEGHCAVVQGVPALTGAHVQSTDLRAAAALALAGLVAQGDTVLGKLHHLDRGYENFDGKLRQLGADVHRLEAAPLTAG